MTASPTFDPMAHLEAFLERVHPGFADDRKLHAEARALSEKYTTNGTIDADAAASVAYLAHFGPRAIAASMHALAFVDVPPACVDVGAGSGASALALFASGAKRVTLVERSTAALDMARRLVTAPSGQTAFDTTFVVGDVDSGAGAGGGGRGPKAPRVNDAALVLSAFAFGEIRGEVEAGARDGGGDGGGRDHGKRSRDDERSRTRDDDVKLRAAAPHEAGDPSAPADVHSSEARSAFTKLQRAAPKAKLHVLVDAGDHDRSRRLQELRDALVVEGRNVVAPCPHRDPCPALVRSRDWCHTRIAKELPAKLAKFARAVGRDDEAMSLSFLVMSSEKAVEAQGIVVIGDSMKEKGRARLPVCGPGGLRFIQALKRNREVHDALLAIERGTRLPPALAEKREGNTASIDALDSLRFDA